MSESKATKARPILWTASSLIFLSWLRVRESGNKFGRQEARKPLHVKLVKITSISTEKIAQKLCLVEGWLQYGMLYTITEIYVQTSKARRREHD